MNSATVSMTWAAKWQMVSDWNLMIKQGETSPRRLYLQKSLGLNFHLVYRPTFPSCAVICWTKISLRLQFTVYFPLVCSPLLHCTFQDEKIWKRRVVGAGRLSHTLAGEQSKGVPLGGKSEEQKTSREGGRRGRLSSPSSESGATQRTQTVPCCCGAAIGGSCPRSRANNSIPTTPFSLCHPAWHLHHLCLSSALIFSPFLFGGNEIDVKKGLREKRENRVVCYNCRQETRTHSARGNRDITLLWLMTSAWTLPFLLPQPPTSSYHPPCLCWFHFHQNVQFASRHHSHQINKWSCTFLSSSPPEKKYKTVLI